MAISLELVPVELLVNIAHHLTTADYGALRRTCKAIEAALFRFWATEFFTVRQTCLFKPSLQNLVDISNHQELKCYVKKIIVGLDSCSGLTHQMHDHQSLFGDDKQRAFRRLSAEHYHMMMTASWKELLSDALKAFPTRQSIQLRDFVSDRLRPREQTQWRGYGIKTFEKDTALNFVPFEANEGHSLMGNILNVCARKDIRMSSLENICRHVESDFRSLYIPQGDVQSYQKSMQHLTQFFVTLSDANITNAPTDMTVEEHFSRLLNCMPQLGHLRINICANGILPITQARRVSSDIMRAVTSCNLHLKKFDIGMANLELDVLQGTLVTLKYHLEHLVLHRIHLPDSDAWTTIIQGLVDFKSMKSFCMNSAYGPGAIGWKDNPKRDVRVSATKRYFILWPLSYSVIVAGDSGASIAAETMSRIVFPKAILGKSGQISAASDQPLEFRFRTEEQMQELQEDISLTAAHDSDDDVDNDFDEYESDDSEGFDYDDDDLNDEDENDADEDDGVDSVYSTDTETNQV